MSVILYATSLRVNRVVGGRTPKIIHPAGLNRALRVANSGKQISSSSLLESNTVSLKDRRSRCIACSRAETKSPGDSHSTVVSTDGS